MTPLAATSLPASAPDRPEQAKLAAAARQFEAIFVRQMLSSARKADFGEPLLGGQAMDTFRQLQDERFADLAADRGAFGIAKMLERQLAPTSPLPLAGGVGGGPVINAGSTSPPLAPPASGRGMVASSPAGGGV
jgi:peptidoglycan hydrolase FlgJ